MPNSALGLRFIPEDAARDRSRSGKADLLYPDPTSYRLTLADLADETLRTTLV